MENFVLPLWWMSMTNEMRPANCWTECEHAKHARSLPCPDDSLYLTDWTDTEIITRERGTWWGISVHKHTETVRYGLWRVPFCRYTGRRRRDCTRSLSFCALSGHLNINVFSWDGMRSAWLCGLVDVETRKETTHGSRVRHSPTSCSHLCCTYYLAQILLRPFLNIISSIYAIYYLLYNHLITMCFKLQYYNCLWM